MGTTQHTAQPEAAGAKPVSLPARKTPAKPPRPAAPVPAANRPSLFKAWRIISRNPIEVFTEDAYNAPCFAAGWARNGVMFINDPDAIERVLIVNPGNYRKSLQQQRRLKPALGEGLLTAEGETWRLGRRLAAPLFTPKAVMQVFDDMAAAAEAMLDRWHRDITPGESFDVAPEFHRLTYDIVSRTVFSGALDADRALVHENMALYFDTIGRVDLATFLNLPMWVPTLSHFRARPAIAVFRDVVRHAFAGRKHSSDAQTHASDLLTRLIAARDAESGLAMSDDEVMDNVLTFLAAGHETTANALVWITYLLALFPAADDAMAGEMDQHLNGDRPKREDLETLAFTRAVVEEALRLYPPAPFIGREAIEADLLCGQHVERGRQILISPWLIHRHRALWERPDDFMPERFLGGARAAIPRAAYLPFGLGPRICVGQAFALQEIMTALSIIIPHYRFQLADRGAVRPLARITLRTEHGLPVKLQPRRSP